MKKHVAQFTLEDELLLSCCRTHLSPDAVARAAESLRHPLDWDYLVRASIQHGVSPIFCSGLEQILHVESANIPTWVWDRLRQLTATSRERNRRIFALVGELFAEFHEAGVPAMALKDAQLAWEVYPDLALRPMGDLDVLVPAEQRDAASRSLAKLGFQPLFPEYRIRDYFWSWIFVRGSDGMWIDLQWNIMQRQWDNCGEGTWKFDLEQMWGNARSMQVGTTLVPVPKPEDMLFHLCVHLEGHGYCELILFCDIVEFLRHYEGRLDWNYFLSLTHASEVESSVCYTLSLARQMFQVRVPEEVLRQLQSSYLKASLHTALFGNLASLHSCLPRIQTMARPLESTMRKFEICARRQAFAARKLFALLNCVEQKFSELGGGTLIFEGSPSEKLLPDDHLASFEPITMLVLDSELDLLISALAENGFVADDQGWRADWQANSRDPVLSDISVQFRLNATPLEKDWLSTSQKAGSKSLASLALRVLLNSLIPVRGVADSISLPLKIVALTPEQLVLRLAIQLAAANSGQLSMACPLSSVLARQEHKIDWNVYQKLARDHHLEDTANTGLITAWRLFSDAPFPANLAMHAAPARVFAVARYGSDWGRFGEFRAVFFVIHSLLATPGFLPKLNYLFKSVWPHKLLRKVFFPAMLSSLSLLRRRRESDPAVYWTKIPVPSAK